MMVILWILAGVGVLGLLALAGSYIEDAIKKAQKRAVVRALDAYAEQYGSTESSLFAAYMKPGYARNASESDLKRLRAEVAALRDLMFPTEPKNKSKKKGDKK